jgi:hypothetical protein
VRPALASRLRRSWPLYVAFGFGFAVFVAWFLGWRASALVYWRTDVTGPTWFSEHFGLLGVPGQLAWVVLIFVASHTGIISCWKSDWCEPGGVGTVVAVALAGAVNGAAYSWLVVVGRAARVPPVQRALMLGLLFQFMSAVLWWGSRDGYPLSTGTKVMASVLLLASIPGTAFGVLVESHGGRSTSDIIDQFALAPIVNGMAYASVVVAYRALVARLARGKGSAAPGSAGESAVRPTGES